MQFLSTLAVSALSIGALAAPVQKRQIEVVADVVSIVSGLKASVSVYLQAINSTVSHLPISANATLSNVTAVEVALDISAITELIVDVTEVLEVALGGSVTTVEGTVSRTVSTVSGTVDQAKDTAGGAVGPLIPRQVGGLAGGAVGTVEKVAADPVNTVLQTAGGAVGSVKGVAGGILRRQIDESAVVAEIIALIEEVTFTLKPIVAIVPLSVVESKISALAASVEGLVGSLDKLASGLLVTVEAYVPVSALAKSIGL
ncbi:unnamed protein product [Zymoseptoria tritici ST99CH_1A5]|uniref:Uncharacterized protein n=3 Tax=Zymoseptoria tritici TaxID=1047171 RepID=A0A1X7RDI7_ZYMT9|nr:unnamed protein product [Zymoseptoria tritici ST99CH_3D7]SMR41825.1 unnamed protein product [Zymoseptoria tritici ST99CH_1E4]SMY19171.1 unnamed protein product [Zymoseptoria tritici ST99CH_1A5]